ncbi:MAG: hypothetical protein FWE53_03335 [Firmicutes bacterium]|nr:hypothetical protein [Bacillota bacterium]
MTKIDAITLCYFGQGLMICAFYDGKYYYIPVKGGEEKLFKKIHVLPAEYENFAEQNEITQSDKLEGEFVNILWHANKFARTSKIWCSICKKFGVIWNENDSDYMKLVNYSKLSDNNDKSCQDSFMYVRHTKLSVIPPTKEDKFPQFRQLSK